MDDPNVFEWEWPVLHLFGNDGPVFIRADGRSYAVLFTDDDRAERFMSGPHDGGGWHVRPVADPLITAALLRALQSYAGVGNVVFDPSRLDQHPAGFSQPIWHIIEICERTARG